MATIDGDNDSESDGEFTSLFKERDECDEVFSFDSIEVLLSSSNQSTSYKRLLQGERAFLPSKNADKDSSLLFQEVADAISNTDGSKPKPATHIFNYLPTETASNASAQSIFTQNIPKDIDLFSNSTVPSSVINQTETIVRFQYTYSHEHVITSNFYIPWDISDRMDDPILRKCLAFIGMCVLPWYWMGFATKTILISSVIPLEDSDIPYWQTLYDNILAEFMFVHHLNFRVQIKLDSDKSAHKYEPKATKNAGPFPRDSNDCSAILLPLGGGKDSIVAWYIMIQQALNPHIVYVSDNSDPFIYNGNLQHLIKLMDNHVKELSVYVPHHDFHCDTFERYARSFYRPCGHPWAALVFFDTVLLSYFQGIRTLCFGHERSANEGNGMIHNGIPVNHQYDKSKAFLSSSSSYVRDSIGLELTFQSAIQEMWELEITKIFCCEFALKPFHEYFQSCNELALLKLNLQGARPLASTLASASQQVKPSSPSNHRHGLSSRRWCLKCEKCAFIFLLISAWMHPTIVEDIFEGHNMFNPNLCRYVASDHKEVSRPSHEGLQQAEGSRAIHDHTSKVPQTVATSEDIRLETADGFGSNIATIEGNPHDLETSPIVEIYKSLCGVSASKYKPFECVGTVQEARYAVYLAAKQYLSLSSSMTASDFPFTLRLLVTMIPEISYEDNRITISPLEGIDMSLDD